VRVVHDGRVVAAWRRARQAVKRSVWPRAHRPGHAERQRPYGDVHHRFGRRLRPGRGAAAPQPTIATPMLTLMIIPPTRKPSSSLAGGVPEISPDLSDAPAVPAS
jgi:hypothetical protein